MSMSTDLSRRYDFARSIADEASTLVSSHFQRGVQVDRKADATPVTVADREAEQMLRRRIESEFSGDGIVGEEFGVKEGQSSFRWILDPIDGQSHSFLTCRFLAQW